MPREAAYSPESRVGRARRFRTRRREPPSLPLASVHAHSVPRCTTENVKFSTSTFVPFRITSRLAPSRQPFFPFSNRRTTTARADALQQCSIKKAGTCSTQSTGQLCDVLTRQIGTPVCALAVPSFASFGASTSFPYPSFPFLSLSLSLACHLGLVQALSGASRGIIAFADAIVAPFD